jgi:hypothetical protein
MISGLVLPMLQVSCRGKNEKGTQPVCNLSSLVLTIGFRGLEPKDLAELREGFAAFDAEIWDRQIEQDAAAGRLDWLAAEGLRDLRRALHRSMIPLYLGEYP